jgi:hypothetical protein
MYAAPHHVCNNLDVFLETWSCITGNPETDLTGRVDHV